VNFDWQILGQKRHSFSDCLATLDKKGDWWKPASGNARLLLFYECWKTDR